MRKLTTGFVSVAFLLFLGTGTAVAQQSAANVTQSSGATDNNADIVQVGGGASGQIVQTGDLNDASIDQTVDGGSDVARTAGIEQFGDHNNAMIDQAPDNGRMQAGNSAFQRQGGSWNNAMIRQGRGGGNNEAEQYQGGDYNDAMIEQEQGPHTAVQRQSGDDNMARTVQGDGRGNSAETYQDGSHNDAVIRQEQGLFGGNGSNQNEALISQGGDYNDARVLQETGGGVISKAAIYQDGSGNTAEILQKP